MVVTYLNSVSCLILLLYNSKHPSACPSVRLSTRPSVHPSVRLSVRLSVRPPVRASIYPSVCLSVYPSARPYVCLSIQPSVCLLGTVLGKRDFLGYYLRKRYNFYCEDIFDQIAFTLYFVRWSVGMGFGGQEIQIRESTQNTYIEEYIFLLQVYRILFQYFFHINIGRERRPKLNLTSYNIFL